MTELEREAVELVRDIVRVATSPDADFAEDGVDERIYAAKVEGVAERYLGARLRAAVERFTVVNPVALPPLVVTAARTAEML